MGASSHLIIKNMDVFTWWLYLDFSLNEIKLTRY